MFVLQWKVPRPSGRYLSRNVVAFPGYAKNTYRSVATIEEATVFTSFDHIIGWLAERVEQGFSMPFGVELVEVVSIPQPRIEVVKVLG